MTLSAIASTATSSGSQLSLQDFLQVLSTQLTHQDPLKPMDNQQFMAQIAQFTTLEQTQQLNENIRLLVGNQAAQQSIGLIGRAVNVSLDGAGGSVAGTVASIDFTGASPTLTVTTASGPLTGVSMAQVTSVRTATP